MQSTTEFNLEQARSNMVEQQVRTWDVLDQSVLDLLLQVKREDFVPAAYRRLAFADMEIPLKLTAADGVAVGFDSGESMFAPKTEARFLQEVALKPHEQVLEVGTGSGFMTALAARKALHVASIEIEPRLERFAQANLARAGARNVSVFGGDGARGWSARAPYDAIFISGSLPVLPPELLAQLKLGGRIVAIVGEAPAMHAQIVTRIAANDYDTLTLFETAAKPLRNAWRPTRFRF